MKQITYDDINIIYEDNHLLVVVKPQNVPSQEDSTKDIDMLTLLKQYIKEKYNKEGNVYLGLVHRLDRPTGGVMVFAKTSKAAARLSEQIKSGEFEKQYLAVVRGVPSEKRQTLVNYLAKNESKNIVSVVTMGSTDAKKAELEYKLLESRSNVSLVALVLKTGRSHQIRVQMAHIGCPLFGDIKYGATENADINGKRLNLALWATDLKIIHPITGERMLFRVFPPVKDIPWSLFNIDMHMNIVAPKDF